MRTSTLLGEIVCLHQFTKNQLKYVHKKSKYRNLVVIPSSDTHESFSRSARYKGWVDKIILHFSGGKEENKGAMEQYLKKCVFEKYEDEAIFPLFNVVFLSAILRIQNQFLPWLTMLI